ncbi:hypothetical protein TorRG33x02_258660 [Trema orientale]|uniref:RNase H type-1 domain-containing protein n=1 Tax=Trema orientale TaxID=63057 RepID=A0A2P5D8R6_TREOI|nr:hypothetical protein TorRG33x02_258660 [Trema orientale]
MKTNFIRIRPLHHQVAIKGPHSILAIVARNSLGEVILIRTSSLIGSELLSGEAWAASLAIDYAIEFGWLNYIFEGDSLTVISELNSSEQVKH